MNFDIKSWGLKEISACLEQSGYGSDDIIDAVYSHTSASDPACVVFSVGYEDIESGDVLQGKVYVSIRNGRITADY